MLEQEGYGVIKNFFFIEVVCIRTLPNIHGTISALISLFLKDGTGCFCTMPFEKEGIEKPGLLVNKCVG